MALDGVGIALLIVGVGAMAYGVVGAEEHGWRSASTLGAVLGGLGTLVGFVVWAGRTAQPVVDLTLFHDRSYRQVNLATFCFGIAFSMMFFAMFFFLMQVWHYTLPIAGLAISPGPLLVIPVAVISGRLASRLGHRPLLVGGSGLYAVGGLWMYWQLSPNPDYLGVWLPGLLMTGTAVGMVLPSLSAAAVSGLAAARFGVGSAVNQAIRQLGSVFGVALTVLLVGHAQPEVTEFQSLYMVHIGLALTTGLMCLGVDTRPLSRP